MIILTQNSSWSTAEPAGVVEVSKACFHLYAVVQHVPKYQRQCPMSWKVWIWQISHIISVKFITSCGIFSTTSAQQRKESRHWLPARTQSHINSLWQHRVCWCEQMSLWFDDNNLSDWITGGIFFLLNLTTLLDLSARDGDHLTMFIKYHHGRWTFIP